MEETLRVSALASGERDELLKLAEDAFELGGYLHVEVRRFRPAAPVGKRVMARLIGGGEVRLSFLSAANAVKVLSPIDGLPLSTPPTWVRTLSGDQWVRVSRIEAIVER